MARITALCVDRVQRPRYQRPTRKAEHLAREEKGERYRGKSENHVDSGEEKAKREESEGDDGARGVREVGLGK